MANRFSTGFVTDEENDNRFDIVPFTSQSIDDVTNSPTLKPSKEQEEAEEFLRLPWWKQVLTRRFLSETPRATAQIAKTYAREILKPFVSLKQLPETLITGKPEDKPVVFPIIGETPSYFYEAQKRNFRIISGDQPLWHAIWPFIEVPLDMIGVGQMLQKGVNMTKSTVSTIKKLQSGEMVGDDLLKSAGKEITENWKIFTKLQLTMTLN